MAYWYAGHNPVVLAFPHDEFGRAALARMVRTDHTVSVRYGNGQLCTFRRRAA